MRWPGKVLVREVGPRDGLQNESIFVPTQAKINLIRALAQAGVPAIEATSFVSPGAVPQLRDAEEVIAGARDTLWQSRLSALVGNARGVQRAVTAGAGEVVMVVSASDAHNKSNLGKTTAESLAGLEVMCTLAREAGLGVRGAVATAFGCPAQGETSLARVRLVVDGLTRWGIEEITLADTAGLGNPRMVYALMGNLKSCYPSITWSLHFHDTRGLGLANTVAGLQAGVTILESSVGGLGGCPFISGAAGNIPTEDLIYMLHGMGIDTGIDLERILRCTRDMEGILGRKMPAKVRLDHGSS